MRELFSKERVFPTAQTFIGLLNSIGYDAEYRSQLQGEDGDGRDVFVTQLRVDWTLPVTKRDGSTVTIQVRPISVQTHVRLTKGRLPRYAQHMDPTSRYPSLPMLGRIWYAKTWSAMASMW